VSPHEDPHRRVLPPGQRLSPELRTKHYGRVPRMHLDTWTLSLTGATASGTTTVLTLEQVRELPRATVRGDLHCASKWSVPDLSWRGVLVRTLLDLVPPAPDVTHVLAFAEYGYSATLRIEDVASPRAVVADELDGEPLTPEHGYPLRLVVPHLYGFKGPKWLRGLEYLRHPVRGFWEQRGYHVVGDAWREERYAYQE
jgi:DMSO/TMAO reductase YedYZ molybdopterin-dependent catalytic subunit